MFVSAFVIALLLFLGLNLLWAHLQSDCGLPALVGMSACADDIRRAGFPLLFWEEGGFAYRRVFSLPSLLIDVGVGLGMGLIVGAFAQWIWPGQR